MKKLISIFFALSPLTLNAMEGMDSSGYLETPTEIVEHLVEAKNAREKDAIPKELFGIVSAKLTGEKPPKIAECLKILHSLGKQDLFDSAVSYFVEQAIQCKQDKPTFDKWFKDEHGQKILEFLKHEFDRQKKYQLAEIFEKHPNLPMPAHNLRSIISPECLSDEMRNVFIDHSQCQHNNQYTKTLNSHYCFVLAISPNNKFIALGGTHGSIKIWDTDNDSLVTTLSGHNTYIECLAFSPDNKLIVTGSRDNTARLWDLNGHCLAKLTDHTGSVYCVAFSPDGNYLATGPCHDTFIIWDITDIKKIKRVAALKDDWGIRNVAFSPDSQNVATLASNSVVSSIKRWDLQGNCTARRLYPKSILCAIEFLDSNILVTGSQNGIQLWSANKLEPIKNVPAGHSGDSVCCITPSPDGQHVASYSRGNKAKICVHSIKGKLISALFLGKAHIMALTFSPDQNITVFQPTKTIVWNWQQEHIDITNQINNLTLEQLMLLNYLDELIKDGFEAAPESTKEVAGTLPPLAKANIEKQIKLPE